MPAVKCILRYRSCIFALSLLLSLSFFVTDKDATPRECVWSGLVNRPSYGWHHTVSVCCFALFHHSALC
uniref:Secreted protein n=1 Tax=Anopheles darlingi TaxID=43151 RepID=A0A2M4DI54_ANODA